MAKPKTTGHRPLPSVGDVFLMPLADGQLGVCRVLGANGRGAKCDFLVAASPWVGTEPPILSDPALREVLVQSRFSFQNEPATAWVIDKEPPEQFRRIGAIAPTDQELRAESNCLSTWDAFAI